MGAITRTRMASLTPGKLNRDILSSIETVSNRIIFYFRGHFLIFQGDIEPTFTLLSNRCQWFGHFWPNNGAIKLSCTAVSPEK